MPSHLLAFKDTTIIPKFTDIPDKDHVDLSVNRAGFPYLNLPIIASPTVSNNELLLGMLEYGAQACVSNQMSIEEQVEMVINSRYGCSAGYRTAIATIGTEISDLDRVEQLLDAGVNTIIIDAEYGATISVVNQAKTLRDLFGRDFGIIVGNFVTGLSIKTFLEKCGPGVVDGFKIGYGSTGISSSSHNFGISIPQLSALLDCSPTLKQLGLFMISDGGIRCNGDIAKALAAGADFVMASDLEFTKHEDLKNLLQIIESDLKESLYLTGSISINEFHKKAEFARLT